jgi:parvulin-like peptidyl-prolyl isomerase
MKATWILSALGVFWTLTATAATPVLRVNGTAITDAELERAKQAISAQMRGANTNAQDATRLAVDRLIGKTLLLQAARAANVSADPAKVAASLDAQRTQAGGADAFAKRLAAAGVTEKQYAAMMEEAAVLQTYMKSQVLDKIALTDAEVKAYYDAHSEEFRHPEQVKLRLILVRVPPGADEAAKSAAKARIEEAHKKLAAGADFAATAKEYSDHPNKVSGGEIGWVSQAMLPQIEKNFWDLKPGEFSDVAEDRFGYEIFKVDERRPAGVTAFDEVKESLSHSLRMRKADQAVLDTISALRAKAKIEALDPAVKAVLQAEATTRPPAASAPPASKAGSAPTATPKPSGDAKKPQ